MHSLMLKTNFIAQHFLIGKDWGIENFKHSHQYRLEIEITSPHIDQFNYIIDIVEFRNLLDKLTASFNDKVLNELPEFENRNPSLEFFSKIIWDKFNSSVQLSNPSQITVRLWAEILQEQLIQVLHPYNKDIWRRYYPLP